MNLNITTDGSQRRILSLIDNKVKEIGIAFLNLEHPNLQLCQYTETSSNYDDLYNMIQFFDPTDIIIPTTMQNSKISDSIGNEYPRIHIVFIARKFYNEVKGLLAIENLVNCDFKAICSEVEKKYLTVSAANALLEYVEHEYKTAFASESLKITYHLMKGYLMLNSSALTRLEILVNNVTGKSDDTLFSILNHTKTAMGKRLLKTTLIQPLNNVDAIQTRLDCLDELLGSEKTVKDLSILSGIPDIDSMIALLVKGPKKMTPVLVTLYRFLNTLKPLVDIVKNLSHPTFQHMFKVFSHQSIEETVQAISSLLDDDILAGKKPTATQHLFAVRSGIDGMLDLSRKVYRENIEKMETEHVHTCETSGIAALKLKNSPTRGYYLSCDIKEPLDRSMFVHVTSKAKSYTFSTENIVLLNARIHDVTAEILLRSEKVLGDLMTIIQKNMGFLYKISECVALLDLLYSFAVHVTLSQDYCRPKITKGGPLAIKAGRDPIIEKRLTHGFYIPNDVYLSENANIAIVNGPNMSGKTSLLYQTAHICLMAHIGCYVPCSFASITLLDRIFTRIGDGDSIEGNMSTFHTEMKETAYILANETPKSLILIDELGRGTSNNEGCSIAWSICESLKGRVIFVTHYPLLSELSSLYPNIKTYHFNVTPSQGNLCFLHTLAEGSCNIDRYGIKLAKMVGIKPSLIESSEKMCTSLEMENHLTLNTTKTSQLKTMYATAQKLLNLRFSTLDLEGIQQYMKNLQK